MAIVLLSVWFFTSPFPRFLLYATPPMEADLVVLFPGPDYMARKKMALELVEEKWAEFGINPFNGKIFGTKSAKDPIAPKKAARIAKNVRENAANGHVEGTHVDMLQTREFLQHFEITRAIFVSSPYHMRRIKLMAERVLDTNRYEIAYVPTIYEPPHRPWFASKKDIKWVFSEYAKILWFLIYEPLISY